MVSLRGEENSSRKGKKYNREGREPIMGDYLASYFLGKKHLRNTINIYLKKASDKDMGYGCRQEMIRPALWIGHQQNMLKGPAEFSPDVARG